MFDWFGKFKKKKAAVGSENESLLKAAVLRLRSNPSEENAAAFAAALKALVDDGAWVHMPCRDDNGKCELQIIESRGMHFAAMFSDPSEVRKSDKYDMIITDINKLLDPVFQNDGIDGIILDPFTSSLCLEKKFLLKCLLHGGCSKYTCNDEGKRDWGNGIPEYADDDVMTPEEIMSFAMQVIMNADERCLQGYRPVSVCDFPDVIPSMIYEKDGRFAFVYVKGNVGLKEPELSYEETEKLTALGRKYNAACFWSPVSFLSTDAARSAEELALRGDGYYCSYRGLRSVRQLRVCNDSSPDMYS